METTAPPRSDANATRITEADAWVFDLDNTLYPASSNLFDQIDRNIDTFQIIIINEATALVVIEDNQLYQTTDLGYHWQKIDQQFPRLYGGLVVNEG